MTLQRSEALEIADRVLDLSGADQTEVLVVSEDSALTRFANSSIHQNVASTDVSVKVRVVLGKQIGVAEVNATDGASLGGVVARAEKIARVQKPNKDFKSLPEGAPARDVKNFSTNTARSTPEERADAVARVVSIAKGKGVERVFGALAAGTRALAIKNSLGVEAFDDMTVAHMTVAAIAERDGEKGYGWAEDARVDIHELPVEQLGVRATEKAVGSLGAAKVEPGEYEVVLEPVAVADLVVSLAFAAFGATGYQEGRSYICGKLGSKIVDPSINLWDDGYSPLGLPMAFDFEGVPKERVDLIRGGVAEGLVYDSYTAGREEGKHSTGHALPAPNPFGPVPMNLFLGPGDAGDEELVGETRRGILVTRFHYTNLVDPTKALWTGMTRDGTFLIEGGEVKGPVKNLRFTDSMVEALASGGLVGRDPRILRIPDWFCSTVPAIKLNRYRFSGVTEF